MSLRRLAVLAEQRRRAGQARTVAALLGSLFPAQADMVTRVLGGQRRSALICGRRGGKSYAIAVLLITICLLRPNARCIWLAITQRNIKRFAWDILAKLNIRFQLGMTPNRSELKWIFPNGSYIELDGCDNVREESEKYTGAAFDAVIIDECGSLDSQLLDFLWNAVFRPTLMDRKGVAILAGTPRHILAGIFWSATRGELPDWGRETWSSLDNPAMRDQILEEIAEMRSADPDIETRTHYRREILGEWCPDAEDFVYGAISERNILHVDMPDTRGWTWAIGCDPGYADELGLVAVGMDPSDRRQIVIPESWSAARLTTAQIVAELREWLARYPGASVVCDPAWSMTVADLRASGLPVVKAQKISKNEAIRTLSGELTGVAHDGGRREILICARGAASLIAEAGRLPWRTVGQGRRVEDPTFPNHMCDAMLYGWRWLTGWGVAPEPRQESYSDRTLRLLRGRAAAARDSYR